MRIQGRFEIASHLEVRPVEEGDISEEINSWRETSEISSCQVAEKELDQLTARWDACHTLEGDMHVFRSGQLSYVMTLLWSAISWQIASVGVVGFIFMVSLLFSNVISTLAVPFIPVFAVIFFHDNMDGIKIIPMLMAIWGFISYGYQLYVDKKKARKTSVSVEENS